MRGIRRFSGNAQLIGIRFEKLSGDDCLLLVVSSFCYILKNSNSNDKQIAKNIYVKVNDILCLVICEYGVASEQSL